MEKPLNPHMTSTASTIANEMPAVGKDSPPPELIKNADPEFTPKDAVPENTERMTSGTSRHFISFLDHFAFEKSEHTGAP